MAMSAAERQRKCREKLKSQAPDKYEEKKRKHAEYMKNQRKPIGELSVTEQNKKRKQWREANERRTNKRLGHVKNEEHKAPPKTDFDRRYGAVLKKLRQTREVIEKLKRENNALKKRVYRQKTEIARLNKIQVSPQNTPAKTPLSKAEYFANNIADINQSDKERVKKKVLENNVLSESLAHVYKTSTDIKTKSVLKNIASNNIVRKYKMTTEISLKLGLKGRIRKTSKTIKTTKSEFKRIKAFFIRDDVSRATPGKKDCLTYNKVKKQKRFLLNTMLKLHSIYKGEGGKASYTTFVRYKPFYVVHPKLSNRDTCVCTRHANLTFKAEKLKKLNLIKTSNLDDLVDEVTCNIDSNTCMYLNCSLCKNREVNIAEVDENTECFWSSWVRKEHSYTKRENDGSSKVIRTKKFEKVVIKATTGELIQQFNIDLQQFKKHYYNIRHQYTCYRDAIDNLKKEEVCVIVDFSENYSCKLGQEIQAMHFGASKAQITLHTGVIYKKNMKPESFASISPCNDHDPGAIWAHLEPVFEHVKQKYPETRIVHMFSDGPSTQYKQKKAFYVLGKLIEGHNLHYGTWSYFESSHGKGAADGVGGTLKRTLDQQIAFGRDVCNARNAYDILSATTKVMLFYVMDDAIKTKQDFIPQNLMAIRGTMQIHQIVYKSGNLKYRSVSCFCEPFRGLCDCFDIKNHNLLSHSSQSPIPGPSNVTSLQLPQRKTKLKSISLSDSDTTIDEHVTYDETDYSTSEKTMKDKQIATTKKFKGKGIGKKSVANTIKTISLNDIIEKENKNSIKVSIFVKPNVGDSKKIPEKVKNKRKRCLSKTSSNKDINPKKRIKVYSSRSEYKEMREHSDSDIVDMISINNSETDCEDCTYSLSRVAKIEEEIWLETIRRDQLSEMENKKEEVNKTNELIPKLTKTYLKKQKKNLSNRKDLELGEEETSNIDILKDVEELSNITDVKVKKQERSHFEEENHKSDLDDRKNEKLGEKEITNTVLNTSKENKDLNNTGDGLNQLESDCSIMNLDVGDTVLGRYYVRKAWKHYVGVVTHINKVRCLYTIEYYKTIKKNGDLTFVKPKKQDTDEVPYCTIVKVICLLKIKENPESFILYYNEDSIYF